MTVQNAACPATASFAPPDISAKTVTEKDVVSPFPEYFREQARQTASKTRIAANSWQTALSVIVDASVPTITPEPACSQTSKGEQI